MPSVECELFAVAIYQHPIVSACQPSISTHIDKPIYAAMDSIAATLLEPCGKITVLKGSEMRGGEEGEEINRQEDEW